jgi:hypothetical protein
MSGGLWFNANYTWAKGITDTNHNGYTWRPRINTHGFSAPDDPRCAATASPHLHCRSGAPPIPAISRALDFFIGVGSSPASPRFHRSLSPAIQRRPRYAIVLGRPDRVSDGNYDSGDARLIKRASPSSHLAFCPPPARLLRPRRLILTGPSATGTWSTELARV